MGFLSFGAVAMQTLDTVKVNGPNYQEIIQNKDLLADVLPPPAYIVEPCLVVNLMPRAKSPEALAELVREGKVRHVGVSNEHAWGLMEFVRLADELGLPRIVSTQDAYHHCFQLQF